MQVPIGNGVFKTRVYAYLLVLSFEQFYRESDVELSSQYLTTPFEISLDLPLFHYPVGNKRFADEVSEQKMR